MWLLVACLVGVVSGDSLTYLQGITCAGSTCDILACTTTGASVPLKLIFFDEVTVRWWLAVDGNFSDIGAAADVIVGKEKPITLAAAADKGAYYEIRVVSPSSASVSARVAKSPVLLSMAVGGKVVVSESAPLSWDGHSSWQSLARDKARLAPGLQAEYFFGGGMQNGRFAHRDRTIVIAKGFNWADGGHPNPVPWYMSTAGYGVLRNTWAPGSYSFGNPVKTSHNETNRLDAFFVFAPESSNLLKDLLGGYTSLTGAPFLPPLYGMFLGDSDCYHNSRHNNSTRVAIAVAAMYRKYDMPAGWMLPNDGYGCGYGEGPEKFPSNLTDLTYVVAELHKLGFYTGLWTSTGMPHIQDEVGVAGTRVCKTDVGWIGSGYKYAFDGVELCANGIEKYSTPSARKFVWTVEGWAGTHRNAVMWTGDDSGSYDYIKWQLPTFAGTGLSAQAHVSGDVDGIFGGSPHTYVRDLQFKALMTTAMVMSGWAKNPDKQPWTFGEPYTSINRASLKLKARLTPYMYTLSREAYDTGTPPVRPMLLEFPHEDALHVHTDATAYQFMAGSAFLVAPVYDNSTARDVYLPANTTWVDWWDGTVVEGGKTLTDYPAPLDVLPLFVRAGSIVPMWPEMNFFNEKAHDPMYLELWPEGNNSFTLYEDDGVTRDALENAAFAQTHISVVAPPTYISAGKNGNVTVSVSASMGHFKGQLSARVWRLNVRCRTPPVDVLLNGTALQEANSEAELEYIASGWYHDPALQPKAGGVLLVKTPSMPAGQAFHVVLSSGPSFPHIRVEVCDTATHRQVQPQTFAYDNATQKIVFIESHLSVGDQRLCLTEGRDKDPDSHTSAVELQVCAPALDAVQQWTLMPSGQIALKAAPQLCIDQDVSVKHVEMYSCHDGAHPGNQGWKVDSGTPHHITSTSNGLCMAVFA